MHTGVRRSKEQVADFVMGRNVMRFLVALLGAVVSVAALLVLGFAGAYQFLEPEIPQAAALREVRSQLPLRVLSRDGKLIAQIGEQRRIPVRWEEMPPVLVDAFVAAEDDRFYEHPGVDWQGLARAVATNVAAGGLREGGGTITMQLARNTVLTSERSLRRKLKEVFLALRLEREFSKQEILTLYLNRIFLGQRAYGVGAAAEVYFDKRVGDLTLAEAALIAGLPRSPSLDNPVASLERAQQRRAYVLRRLLELGRIDRAAHDAALAAPISGRRHGPIIELDAPYVAEMVRAEMLRRHGPAALTDGYAVTTTLDSRLQQAANAAVWRAVLEYERRHGYRGPLERVAAASVGNQAALAAAFARHPARGSLLPAMVTSVAERSARVRRRSGTESTLEWDDFAWARPALENDVLGPLPKTASDVLAVGDVVYLEPQPEGRVRLAQLPAVAGALVALDPRDGAIVSLVGGFDFDESKYNHATQAQRQPGSAFKPFLYSAALEKGFTPATLVNDAPIVLAGGGGIDGDEEWRPQNITRRFYGPTPMREGLVRSRNLVSIRLLRGTGLGFATRHIGNFGFGPSALPANLTLALGTGQATPLDMVRGFATFANGGFRVTPYFIVAVLDAAGREVFKATPPLACPECSNTDSRRAGGHRCGTCGPRSRCGDRRALGSRAGRPPRPAGNQPCERLRHDRHDDRRDPARHRTARRAHAQPARHRGQDRHDQRPARYLVRGLQCRPCRGRVDRLRPGALARRARGRRQDRPADVGLFHAGSAARPARAPLARAAGRRAHVGFARDGNPVTGRCARRAVRGVPRAICSAARIDRLQ